MTTGDRVQYASNPDTTGTIVNEEDGSFTVDWDDNSDDTGPYERYELEFINR